MAKKSIDTEALMKHRFWIGVGVFVPLVLVFLCFLLFGVRTSVDAKEKFVTNSERALKNLPNPVRNTSWIPKFDERDKRANDKKNEIWDKAWKTQASLFTWPAGMKEDPTKKPYGYAFGEDTREEYALRLYETQLAELPRLAQPEDAHEDVVQFRGGKWQDVITVAGWARTPPDPEELWLAQEDLWIQKAILRAIRDANEMAGIMRRVGPPEPKAAAPAPSGVATAATPAAPPGPPPTAPQAPATPAAGAPAKPPEPAKPPQPPAKPSTPPSAATAPTKPGKPSADEGDVFENLNWRIALKVGTGPGKIFVRARLTNLTNRRQTLPVQFRLYFPGNLPTEVLSVDGEPLGPAESCTTEKLLRFLPERIEKVGQAFTWRNAPIKRIDMIAMGAKSCLNSDQQLLADPQLKLTDESKKGETINHLNPVRYIQVTQAVRRMPIGLVLVVDQRYLDEILAAFANSPVRLFVNQIGWQHVKQSISAPPKPTKSGTPATAAGPTTPPPGAGGAARPIRSGGGRASEEVDDTALTPTPGVKGVGGAPLDDSVTDQVRLAIYGVANLYKPYPPIKLEEPKAAAAPGSPAK